MSRRFMLDADVVSSCSSHISTFNLRCPKETLEKMENKARAYRRSPRVEIWALKLKLIELKRVQCRPRCRWLSERIDHLEFVLEDLEAAEAATRSGLNGSEKDRERSRCWPLPEHLPRSGVINVSLTSEQTRTCASCVGAMRAMGDDVSEMLEYISGNYQVVRFVGPKLICVRCKKIVQALTPFQAITGGLAGPGVLAHVLMSKYADHLPLYRQSQNYADAGLKLERSTLAGWVGGAHKLLSPLIEVLGRHVLSGTHLHADNTPYPILARSAAKTTTARFWAYVRDERPWGSEVPPAVLFHYTPDRNGVYPCRHLTNFNGALHAVRSAGFHRLFNCGRVFELASWADARYKFVDLREAVQSPIAKEALNRISALYDIEKEFRGASAEERQVIRQTRAGPLLVDLHAWLRGVLRHLSRKSESVEAPRYLLSRWEAFCRYRDDGRAELDNKIAKRSLRIIALGRTNHILAGAAIGGERAAGIYSLIGTASLNGIDPGTYLHHVLERIEGYPSNRLAELLPWNTPVREGTLTGHSNFPMDRTWSLHRQDLVTFRLSSPAY